MYTVKDFYTQHDSLLQLGLIGGYNGLDRRIWAAEADQPGLFLAGYSARYSKKRILVFGKEEMRLLRGLDLPIKIKRLETILDNRNIPAILITHGSLAPTDLISLCNRYAVPLFRTNMTTMKILNKLATLLTYELAPLYHCRGALVEVFGIGLLLQTDGILGTSETSLGLIEKRHRLISNEIISIKKCEGSYLEGSGIDPGHHHMDIRGIGTLNVAQLYGAVSVRKNIRIGVVVKLEEWNQTKFYDRVGIDEKFCEILGIKIPYHILPVKSGRDIALLLETLVLNHHLKSMGHYSVKEFESRLLEITRKKVRQR